MIHTSFFFGAHYIYYMKNQKFENGGTGNMPIYEYECRNCKEKFEVLQKIDEGNEGLCCPKCNSDKPEKVLSAFCSGTAKGGAAGVSAHSAPGHS
jgi:putative FmdB family regulatory protein